MQQRLLAASTLAIVALAACSDSTTPAAGRSMSLSFSAAPAAGATFSQAPASGASRSVAIASGTDSLVISRVRVVVARMELKATGASCTSTAAAGDDVENECEDLQVAPSVVELPVDGTVLTTANGAIPVGTYSALEAKIRPIRSGSDHGTGSVAFLKANPDLDSVSVVVEGTWNKTAFKYTGTPRAEFETTFNPPITIDSTTKKNLTVQVDVASWFKTSTGTLINPATAAAGQPNASVVADNIRRSIRAFQDNDHNGRDDKAEGH